MQNSEQGGHRQNGIRKALSQRQWSAVVEMLQPELDTAGKFGAARDYASLASGYSGLGQTEQARAVLHKAMDRHAANTIILRAIGELEFQAGNHEAAATYWSELLKRQKGKAKPRVFLRLSASLKKLQRRDDAIGILDRGLALHPGNARMLGRRNALGRMEEERSREEKRDGDGRPAKHPYKGRPERNFWTATVSSRNPLEIDTWYRKKFSLSSLAIAAGGSCFAQHLGKRLRSSGFHYIDAEPAPKFLDRESHADFGYGLYSARYGNIYTSRQLLQLLQRATGAFKPAETAWEFKDGLVDPFRPTIEPEPFASMQELELSRRQHLEAVVEMIRQADVYVFTLGLTEAWINGEDGAAYPVAPGVSGGRYDPGRHRLLNLTASQVHEDMHQFMALARTVNPRLKLLMTVSPVPLMATATDDNVVVATTYSKSVLRAVAGQIAAENDWADYFPSFEIISSHVMRGQFFNPDMRTVSPVGVDHVMKQFFAEHRPLKGAPAPVADEAEDPDAVVCDEELLRSFER